MNCLIGKICVGRAGAETACRLQRVLKTNGDMPPIQHNRGCWQRLALHPPQPGITIAQHCRRRVGMHPSCSERLRECFGRGRLAVPGEGEPVLGAIGVDHLARNHLEMALLLPVPVAHVAAVKPDHNGTAGGGRSPLRRLGGVLAHDFLAHPPCPVSDSARVWRPAGRQQLGQQDRNFAERHQRGISGRDVGQLWCNHIMTEI
jgi:hypothetical protein